MARANTGSTSNYLTVGSAVVSAYPLTMACWFNTSDVANRKTMMSINKTADNGNFEQLLLGGNVANDPVLLESNNGTTVTATSTAGVSGVTGVWSHAAGVVVSTTDRRAFYNGANKGTTATSQTIGTPLQKTNIGAFFGAGVFNAWNGSLAWPAIWNVALSDDEIAALGAGAHPLTIRPSAIVAFWPLTGESDAGEIDVIGAYPLTETGAMTTGESPLVTLGWPMAVTRSGAAAPSTDYPFWAVRNTVTIQPGGVGL